MNIVGSFHDKHKLLFWFHFPRGARHLWGHDHAIHACYSNSEQSREHFAYLATTVEILVLSIVFREGHNLHKKTVIVSRCRSNETLDIDILRMRAAPSRLLTYKNPQERQAFWNLMWLQCVQLHLRQSESREKKPHEITMKTRPQRIRHSKPVSHGYSDKKKTNFQTSEPAW